MALGEGNKLLPNLATSQKLIRTVYLRAYYVDNAGGSDLTGERVIYTALSMPISHTPTNVCLKPETYFDFRLLSSYVPDPVSITNYLVDVN
jgi:hypothetical protein